MQKFIQEAKVNSCCLPFILLNSERTIIELDGWTYFTANVWKYPYNLWILVARISIKETVHFLAVSMQIKNEPDLPLFT
jgi:hypothetical protein